MLSSGRLCVRSTRGAMAAVAVSACERALGTLNPEKACPHAVACANLVHSPLFGLSAECARVSDGPRELVVSPRGTCACLRAASL